MVFDNHFSTSEPPLEFSQISQVNPIRTKLVANSLTYHQTQAALFTEIEQTQASNNAKVTIANIQLQNCLVCEERKHNS